MNHKKWLFRPLFFFFDKEKYVLKKMGTRGGCQKSILQKIMYSQYVSYPQDQPHQKLTRKSPLYPKNKES